MTDKLQMWQTRLRDNEAAYRPELEKMDHREALYSGDRKFKRLVPGDHKFEAVHVRNVCSELVEAQIDSNIPAPTVTARRKDDEDLAQIIETMLRNEMDRLPAEEINDMIERIVPIQGGVGYLVEWDSSPRAGDVVLSFLHPKQIIPQAGVFTSVEDMDYVILKIPETKGYIKRRFGVDVSEEGEEEPEVRSGDESDDMVTMYVAYYRNDSGGIGKYSWVGDTEIEDMDCYQARRLRRCKVCGALEDEALEPIEPTEDGTPGEPVQRSGCRFCGSDSWESAEEEYEEIYEPIQTRSGAIIPGVQPVEQTDDDGNIVTVELKPTRIKYYRPDIFPVILQRNVSVYGRLLGESDIDKIEDQQNTINRIETKIIDKLLQSGSYITLPDDASIRVDADDMKVIRPGSAANKALIDVYDLQGNITPDMSYLQQVYEEARQTIGITDSFQGRRDATATSGKAKEFAAAQSAGRLESKRVLKQAAYASLYEAIFKFKLAYTDAPMPVVSTDTRGGAVYDEFSRYDFLEQDETGEWVYNDKFLFSCDTSAPLANNREAMWQETRLNFQTGAFGDPTSLDTLILFWTKMDALHYPDSKTTLDYLKELQQRQMQAQIQQQRQAQIQQLQQRAASGDPTAREAVIRQAQRDAQMDMQQQLQNT